MQKLQKLVFYNCKGDKQTSVFPICIFVGLDYFAFKGVLNKKNWINKCELSAVIFGYLCSIFAILAEYIQINFSTVLWFPLFPRIILRTEPLTRISLVKK